MNTARVEGSGLTSSSVHSSAGGQGRLREAAEKFEALLVSQLLRAARHGAAGEAESDQTAASLTEMGEERLAEALTSQGGLGLAQLIVDRLAPGFEAGKASEDLPIRR